MDVERDPVSRWLATALLTVLAVNILIVAGLMFAGDGFVRAFESTAFSKLFLLRNYIETDSWLPMLQAYHAKMDGGRGLYELLFAQKVKFQYPPTSLIFFQWLPDPVLRLSGEKPTHELMRCLTWLSRAALFWTVFWSASVLHVGARALAGRSGRPTWKIALFCLVLGLTYYPLVFAFELGQTQIFIDAAIAFAVFAMVKRWDFPAGLFVGLACLMKPQCGLFLVWALFRKRWKFATGLLISSCAGLAVSVAVFGWHDHFEYLKVLRFLSSHGEVYWANQSVNGILHRLFGNGDPVRFSDSGYASYHSLVHAGTMIGAVFFLAAALWKPRAAADGTADFSLMLLAVLLSSPITWEHHYGVLLPVFAALLPALMHARPLGKMTWVLLLFSYTALAQAMVRPEILFADRWISILGAHFFLGALALFGLIWSLRNKGGAGV